MNLREAAQQALEALEEYEKSYQAVADGLKPLRAALAEDRSADSGKTSDHIHDATKMVATSQESRQVEPVAWMCSDESLCRSGYERFSRVCEGAWNIPVYTAPPKRQPLTNEEISKIFIYCGRDKETFARAIERAHGIGGEE